MTAHRDAGILTAKEKRILIKNVFQSPSNRKPLAMTPAF
jgi:hypothetical protein